jgi:hypothetical protein
MVDRQHGPSCVHTIVAFGIVLWKPCLRSHLYDHYFQLSGEEVLTVINGPLDDLQYAVLEVAGQDNCSAAA